MYPVKGVVLEVGFSEFQKMENLEIKGTQYQKGALFGFKNPQEYLFQRRDGESLLCSTCHAKVHKMHADECIKDEFLETMEVSYQKGEASLPCYVVSSLLQEVSALRESRKGNEYVPNGW